MNSIKNLITEMKLAQLAKKEIAEFTDKGINKLAFIGFDDRLNPTSESEEDLLKFFELFKKHLNKSKITRNPKSIGQNKDKKDIYAFEVDMSKTSNEKYHSGLKKILKEF